MDRSADNKRVGKITVTAWQMEERADQRMAIGRMPDSISGRVRASVLEEHMLKMEAYSECNATVNML